MEGDTQTTHILNALRLIKRRQLPSVTSEQLCDILVGRLVLAPDVAWFRQVDNYGCLQRSGREAVLLCIQRLTTTGVLEPTSSGHLKLVSGGLPGAGAGLGGSGAALLAPGAGRKRPLHEMQGGAAGGASFALPPSFSRRPTSRCSP